MKKTFENKEKQSRKKLTYKDQRDLERLPAEIDKLDSDITKLEAELADPGFFNKNPDLFNASVAKLGEHKAQKVTYEDRWLELEILHEKMNSI